MLFDVKPILYTPGKRLDFQFDMDLPDVGFFSASPDQQSVHVAGNVRNSAGVLHLELTASATLDARCDRCGKAFPLHKEIPFSCILAQEVQNEDQDEIVLLEDGQADVEDLARTAFILGMDTKILCSEDCKGLCPRCGADLNAGPCSCRRKEPDPRWAALAKLLENS